MKNSPVNGPGTPRDDLPPVSGTGDMGAYNLPYQDNVSQISLWIDLNWCDAQRKPWDIFQCKTVLSCDCHMTYFSNMTCVVIHIFSIFEVIRTIYSFNQ